MVKRSIIIKVFITIVFIIIFLIVFTRGNDSIDLIGDNDEQNSQKGLLGDLELQVFAGGYGQNCWREAVEGFQKENPELNITINIGNRINEQMKTRWISNNPPDIVFLDGPDMPTQQFAADGRFMDLSEFFDSTILEDGKPLRDHIMDGLIIELEGKEYFAPYILSCWGLFYDEKLFRDNGIAIPSDFDELLQTGEEFEEIGLGLLTYPGDWPGYLWNGFVIPGLISEGGQELYDDVISCKQNIFISNSFVNVIKKIEVLRDKGFFMEGTMELNHIESQTKFLQRKAAFIPTGLWLENEMYGKIPENFEMSFYTSPIRSKGQKIGLNVSGTALAISAGTKNPEAALAFLKYLYREDVAKRFIEASGAPSVMNIDISELNCSPLIKSVSSIVNHPDVDVTVATTTFDPRLERVAWDSLTLLVTGEITAEEYSKILNFEASKIP